MAVGAEMAIGNIEEWDAYSGDGIAWEDTSLIGADNPGFSAAVERQVSNARNVDSQAVMIRREIAKRRRYLDLGMTPTLVGIGATATITIQTQRVFRTERVYIPDAVAGFFSVTQAFVGQNSQFAGSAPVSAVGWSNQTFDPKGVLWDTASPGLFITLTVQNLDVAARTFSGSMRGTSTVR